MKLITEDLPEIDGVTPSDLDRVLREDCFGKFVILSASDDEALQAASAWEPTEECAAFLRLHHSDPWILERRGPSGGSRAAGFLTSEQIRLTFIAHLRGDQSWQYTFTWVPTEGT